MTARLELDVLSNRPARRLLGTAAFPLVLQLLALAGVLALAVNGWGIGADASAADLKLLRKTNLTTLFVWGLWWPGMIAAALLLGRAWCTVCPMELVNRAGDAAARVLRLPRLRLGRTLRAGWVVVAAYLTLQLFVAGASIHRIPHATAIVLLALLGTALATGAAFSGGRSFCKGFCPAGALLSVYGRFTPIGLDVRDRAVCDRCTGKDCVAAENRDRLDRRSCPSSLRPFARAASDGCVLCLQCAKVCPERNVGLGVLGPDAPQRGPSLLKPAEAAFVMIASGFVTHELTGEVEWVEALFHRVPDAAARLLGAPGGWVEAAWFLVVFPALLWSGVALVARLAGQRGGAGALLLPAATAAAPVIAVAHLAKALAKLASWGAYLPGALRDPAGLATFQAIRSKASRAPGELAALSHVGAVMLVGVALLALWSWRRSAGGAARSARVAVGVTAALMVAVLAAWARA